MHELASALTRAGHSVHILTTSPTPTRSVIGGVPVRYLRRREIRPATFGPLADEVAFGAQAFGHLGLGLYDVWHAMGTADAAAAATVGLGRRRVRTVYTDHGFPNVASRSRRPDRRLHQHVVRHINRYVCVSNAAGNFLRDGFGREPVVLSGGVDLASFAPAAQRSRGPVMLFAGDASEERKNLPLLFDALAVLRHTEPAVELWVAGAGDQEAALASAPRGIGDAVRLLGPVAPGAMADLYGRAWVTVLPAAAEAFGLVLVESLACGTPIVSLDQGGPTEIVQPAVGRTASPDATDLARACGEALDLARTAGIAETCRDAARPWDWATAIVPRMEQVYGDG